MGWSLEARFYGPSTFLSFSHTHGQDTNRAKNRRYGGKLRGPGRVCSRAHEHILKSIRHIHTYACVLLQTMVRKLCRQSLSTKYTICTGGSKCLAANPCCTKGRSARAHKPWHNLKPVSTLQGPFFPASLAAGIICLSLRPLCYRKDQKSAFSLLLTVGMRNSPSASSSLFFLHFQQQISPFFPWANATLLHRPPPPPPPRRAGHFPSSSSSVLPLGSLFFFRPFQRRRRRERKAGADSTLEGRRRRGGAPTVRSIVALLLLLLLLRFSVVEWRESPHRPVPGFARFSNTVGILCIGHVVLGKHGRHGYASPR